MKKLFKEEFTTEKEELSKELFRHIKLDKNLTGKLSFIGLSYEGHIFKIKNRNENNIPEDNYVDAKKLTFHNVAKRPVTNAMLSIEDIDNSGKELIDKLLRDTIIVEPAV